MLEVMCVFVHMPDVRNVLLFQIRVNALADAGAAPQISRTKGLSPIR